MAMVTANANQLASLANLDKTAEAREFDKSAFGLF